MNCGAAMKADLLVMGTHGLGAFDRLLLGSVTEKVARTAACPYDDPAVGAHHDSPADPVQADPLPDRLLAVVAEGPRVCAGTGAAG